jgi:hypothetical protein
MKALLTMRQALEDRAIMGAAFSGDSWMPWRCLMIAANGEELSSRERGIYVELTGRAREPLERVDELIAIKGRRSGGTTAAAGVLAYNACLVDYSDVLGAGEKALALCLAPTARQATIAFERTSGLVDSSEMLRSMVAGRTQETISLVTNVSIEVRPASFRGLRGVTCCAVCLDEAAYFAVEGVNTDSEILQALRPSLITTRGMLMIASTPYATEGELFRLHQDHFGAKGDAKLLVAKATSKQTNPLLPQQVIDRAIQRDPAGARSEYLAEFRSDISAFIDRDVIERAIDRGIVTRPGQSTVCFLDAASGVGGAEGDRFAACWGHREGDLIVIDETFLKRPPFDASITFSDIAAICRQRGVTEIVSDAYSIGFVVAESNRHGLTHRRSDLDKSRLYLHALPNLTSNRVRLVDVPEIVEEFALLERKPGANGHDKVDARGNRPEDLANCCAGVIWLLSGPQSSAENWIEFYRRLNVLYGTDEIPKPVYGYGFGPPAPPKPDLIKMFAPPGIAVDGYIPVGGTRHPYRYDSGRPYVSVSREHARQLLERDSWRAENAVAIAAMENIE